MPLWRGVRGEPTLSNDLPTFLCADEAAFRSSLTLSKAVLMGFWSFVMVMLAVWESIDLAMSSRATLSRSMTLSISRAAADSLGSLLAFPSSSRSASSFCVASISFSASG